MPRCARAASVVRRRKGTEVDGGLLGHIVLIGGQRDKRERRRDHRDGEVDGNVADGIRYPAAYPALGTEHAIDVPPIQIARAPDVAQRATAALGIPLKEFLQACAITHRWLRQLLKPRDWAG